jgi:RNA polymerase sigma-70 factor (ECF subfamily)
LQKKSQKKYDGRVHDGDLELARACGRGDAAALERFEREFLNQVPLLLARTHAELADEVMQALRHKLFVDKKIDEYSGKGPLGGWLRVVAMRTAIDLRRDEKPRVELPRSLADQTLDSPELAVIKERYLPELKAALSESLQRLTSEERNLLRLHLLDGLNLEQIAKLFAVNRSTVFRWLAATREKLFADARRHLREKLGVSDEEFDSLAQLVRSRLDLSLSEIL